MQKFTFLMFMLLESVFSIPTDQSLVRIPTNHSELNIPANANVSILRSGDWPPSPFHPPFPGPPPPWPDPDPDFPFPSPEQRNMRWPSTGGPVAIKNSEDEEMVLLIDKYYPHTRDKAPFIEGWKQTVYWNMVFGIASAIAHRETVITVPTTYSLGVVELFVFPLQDETQLKARALSTVVVGLAFCMDNEIKGVESGVIGPRDSNGKFKRIAGFRLLVPEPPPSHSESDDSTV